MESLQEQIEYGGHCIHGTNVGTPGGADLMCGLCEQGLDQWVPDPQFELMIWTRADDWWPARGIRTWYQSDIDETDPFGLIAGFIDLLIDPDEPLLGWRFEARQIAAGYWDDGR